MTPQTDPRQALITEIDSVLSKTQSRLPWVMAGEVTQQRRVLRRVRDYLASLPTSPTGHPALKGQLPSSTRPTPQSRRRLSLLGADLSQESQPAPQPQNAANQEIVQAVVQDLRSSILMPLQAEIAALSSQREQMRQELQYMDQQRRNSSMSGQSQKMMTEFFQSLIDRCAESLTEQVAENLANLQVEYLQYRSSEPHDPILAPDSNADPALLTPQERLEQLRALQAQSDKLLKTLDASINVVFETLQSNLQSYGESMTQGIEHMYSLGQQGEVMFSALVNRLASQLGREASSYIQNRSEESSGGTLEQSSGGKSLNPSVRSPETDRSAHLSTSDHLVSQPTDPQPQEMTEVEDWDNFEAESMKEEEPEDLEELGVLDEEMALEFFEQLEESEDAVDVTEEVEDRPSDESSADVDLESEELEPEAVIEGDEFYDALFGSDQFTTAEVLEEGESGDPLQELVRAAESDRILPEAEPEPDLGAIVQMEEAGAVEGEAIAETLETDLFEGLDEGEAAREDSAETAQVEDLPSKSAVVESSLFELAPPPSQVEDPVSLETFMELFGEEDPPPQMTSENLETDWAKEMPLNSTEDVYIPASPDEVLLPTDLEETQGVSQLNLQGEVLEQLSQDLFSLEGEGTAPVPPPAFREEDLFGTLESVEAAPSLPEEETALNTENFLNEILTPEPKSPEATEALEDRGNAETAETGESLFAGFREDPELPLLLPEEEATDLNPLWEDENGLPESLTIDTVFGEEAGTLDPQYDKSISLDQAFEGDNQENRDAIDPSTGRGRSTLENMFDGFLLGENRSIDPDRRFPASSDMDSQTQEETFTLEDVFEGFADDNDPDPPLNFLNRD